MAIDQKPLIAALKKEAERLEGIAAHFEESHSIHLKSVQQIIHSINEQINKLEAGDGNEAG
jgi:hypothetical protein